MDTLSCTAYICLAMAVYVVKVGGQVVMEELRTNRIDPLSMNDTEPYTELTIDQIISQAMGGYGRFGNMMVAPDGNILAELDMYLSQVQYNHLYEPNLDRSMTGRKKRRAHESRRSKRKAIRDPILRWPNATVPYTFVNGHFSDEEQYNIKTSMTEWERYTCLRFREAHRGERNVVRFQDGMGCNSQLGMVGGSQALNLDRNGCRYKGLYLHEIGHAVGLVHEHQLPDRDKYIEIIYGNVQPDMRVWFNKYATAKVNQMNVDYEYSSVMHYGITAFSYNNKAQTIRAKQPEEEKRIGRVYKKQLSFSDVKIVNLMYNCADHCPRDIVCRGKGFVDQNCKCICPDGTDTCTKSSADRTSEDLSCFDSANDPWQCKVWSNQGECERNPKFMLDMCRKSCDLCGNKDETRENTCKDVYESYKCGMWKNRGECVVNKKWMNKNCKHTCKECGDNSNDPDIACDNVHGNATECAKWASEGECFINPGWMPKNCRKSCKMCSESEIIPTTTPRPDPDGGKCEDDYNTVECQNWANNGECTKNPKWMIPNCRKSCKKCDELDGDCKNTWDDSSCEMWARDQECMKNSVWMHKNCRQACTKCNPPDDRDQGGKTVPTTTQPPQTTSGDVRNNHRNNQECDNWAKHGHCEINEWMMTHCALSCQNHRNGMQTTTKKPDRDDKGRNDQGDHSCVDEEQHCPSWAKYGFCEDNPATALRICKMSCNNCVKSAADCFDKHAMCPVWANGKHCSINSGYMLLNCRKSCGRC